MVTARLDTRAMWALLVVAAIWATVLAIHAAKPSTAVAIAGSLDLTLTAGVVAWFAVRGGHLSGRAAWLVVAAGAIAARILLGTANVVAAVAVLELLAVAMVVVRVRKATRGWREARAANAPRLDALDHALAATGLPARVAGAMASELAVVGYAFAGWRAPDRRENVFTVHRVNGWALYAGVFAVLVLAETPVAHIALAGFDHPTAAWVATALSLYSVLWLVGDLHALRHGGAIVSRDALELRLGARWRGRIPRARIARVERGAAPDKRADFSILGANVVVYLDTPTTLHGLGGRRRTTSVVALSIDEPDRFIELLRVTPRS